MKKMYLAGAILLLLSSCTVNKTIIQNVEGNVYMTPQKDLVPPSRADRIRALYYKIDTTVIYIDNAQKQHEKNKLYIKSKGL